MVKETLQILLADDDLDDCMFFEEVLAELPISSVFNCVNDGEQLLLYLRKNPVVLPDVLFMDLNMPRMNGFDCLEAIKQDEKLKQIPVVIFSTSFDQAFANLLYLRGAHYYICKPAEFINLKFVIHKALTLITQSLNSQPPQELFIIHIEDLRIV